MKVFYIVVVAIVTLALLYIISQVLILPSDKAEDVIAYQLVRAINEPNSIISSTIGIRKNAVISSLSLQNNSLLKEYKNLKILLRYDDHLSNSIDIDYTDTNDAVMRLKSNIYKENMQIICNSGLLFYDNKYEINKIGQYNYVCEVIFGSSIKSIENFAVKDSFDSNIIVGTKPINYTSSINNSYYIKYFLFDDSKNQNLSSNGIYFLQNRTLNSFGQKDADGSQLDVNFNVNDKQLLLVAYVPKMSNYNNFNSNTILSPLAYDIFKVNVVQTYQNLSENCKASDIEKTFVNLDNDMCEVKYKCNGCRLPSMCSDAWENKGYKNIESATSSYAIGYIEKSECS